MMKTLIPSFLNIGDSVGVWAPARYVTPEFIDKGLEMIKAFGFQPVVLDLVFSRFNQFAGKEGDRIELFNQLVNDNSIQAIVCAKGGYGSMRLLEQLDFGQLVERPKWICGFSDVTAVHAWLNHYLKIPSVHGMMLTGMDDSTQRYLSTQTLLNALCGRLNSYEISAAGLLNVGLRGDSQLESIQISGPSFFKEGKVKARFIGGNLSLLYALASTPYDLPMGERFILFIEDLDEYLYHIDRMMQQLKLSGKLDRVAGVLVGGMTDMKDNVDAFGKDAYEIVQEYLEELDVPYYMGFPAGHQDLNLALYLGVEATLSVEADGSCKLQYLIS